MNPRFYLREHPVLRLASEAAMAAAARRAEVRRHNTGARVIRPTMPQTHVLVLAEGSLRLSQKNSAEKTELLLGTVAAPAIFGDAELCAGVSRWSIHAVAAEPTLAVWLENDAYMKLIASDVSLAHAMYRDASARHMLTVELMQVFGLQSLSHRMLRLLWTASQEGADGRRTSPLNQLELARSLGVNRKTIARHLQRLEELGLVRRAARSVQILVASTAAFADRPLARGLGASWQLPIR